MPAPPRAPRAVKTGPRMRGPADQRKAFEEYFAWRRKVRAWKEQYWTPEEWEAERQAWRDAAASLGDKACAI